MSCYLFIHAPRYVSNISLVRWLVCCAVHETIRVKSAAWDDTGVLVYTTLNHIKYCLPNGDSGIIRTLEVPVYITRVSGSSLHCLDRDGKTRQIQVSPLFESTGQLCTCLYTGSFTCFARHSIHPESRPSGPVGSSICTDAFAVLAMLHTCHRRFGMQYNPCIMQSICNAQRHMWCTATQPATALCCV